MLQMLVQGDFRSIPRKARGVVFWQRYRGNAFHSRLRRHARSSIDEIRRYLCGLVDGDVGLRWLGEPSGQSEVQRA